MPKLIGLSGYARSGKDTVADFLSERRAYNKLSFANEIRTMLYGQNPLIDYQGHHVPLADAVDAFGWEELKGTHEDGAPLSKTLRPLMQRTGMFMRDRYGADYWIRLLMNQVHGKVVIADVRFENEADAIRELGGEIWRIQRDSINVDPHPSETALDGYEFDYIIHNNLGLASLYEQVERSLGAE